MSDPQTQLSNVIVPKAQEIIAEAVGKDIPVDVKLDTFTSEAALQTLTALGGYNVLMRVVLVLKTLVAEYDAQDDLKDKLVRIEVACAGEESITAQEGTLHISLALEQGISGAPSKVSLQRAVAKALQLAGRKQRKLIDEVGIPEAQQRIKQVIGVDVPIEVDWDTVYDQPDFTNAMYYMAYWRGYYVFGRAASSVYQAVEWDHIDKNTMTDLVKKIVIRGLPGEHYRARYVRVKDGVMEICCAFSSYWGIPYVYEMKLAIKAEAVFRELDAKLSAGASLTEEDQKRKIEVLQEVSRREPVINGHWQDLHRALQHRCFFTPDEVEQTAMDCFVEKYAGYDPDELRRTKKDRWGELDRVTEEFIHGWRINKINHRGQEQLRFAVLTSKAFYTFKWNFKKSEPELRRTHRVSHDNHWHLTHGKLRERSALGGAAGGAMDAVAGESKRYGVYYRTNIVTSKKETMLKQAIGKFLKGKELSVIRTLTEQQLKDKDDLPEVTLPGYIPMELHTLCRIAATSLSKADASVPESDVLAQGGDVERMVSISDVFGVLQDSFEGMEKQPELTLPNAPDRRLDVVFAQVLDTLDKIETLNIEFPTTLNLAGIVKNITDTVSDLEQDKLPQFHLPDPSPLTISQIVDVIRTSLASQDATSVPETPIPGLNTQLVDIEAILGSLESNAGDLEVVFPGYAPYDLVPVLEKVGEAFGDVSGLPSTDLLELSIGGTSIKSAVPSINVDVPGGAMLRKLRGEEPRYFEMVFEPVLANEDLLKSVSQEIVWAIYGALRAYHSPYYVWSPWETSQTLPNSHLGVLYNKMRMGDDKKPDSPTSTALDQDQ